MRVIRLSEPHIAEIHRHAAEQYPLECCGGLLGKVEGEDFTVRSVAPVMNTHHEGHERRYSIAPEDMLRLEKQARAQGLKVIGFYHSHPDHPATPSQYDLEHAWPWYVYVIVSVTSGRPDAMTCWTLNEDRSAFHQVNLHMEVSRNHGEET